MTESEYFQSKGFQEEFTKIVNRDTWDKNLPKYYVDKEGWLVEHWKEGKLIKIKKVT